ncbi:hypothetical protein [Roseomonas sp. USHLN139]|uniref:hypothetical protein n=1 Tax=Roseomonas sp. USHLN139 TaxID=3081298 RepID=UPI003B02A74D
MFDLGDIVRIFAPTAGYKKYHLCIKIADDAGVARFMYLNSDPNFGDTLALPCGRVPCLPVSETGFTAFSFSMLPGYSQRQLELYKAEKLGEVALDVAQELRTFANGVEALSRAEKRMVAAALEAIILSRKAAAAAPSAQSGQAGDEDLGDLQDAAD